MHIKILVWQCFALITGKKGGYPSTILIINKQVCPTLKEGNGVQSNEKGK